MKDITVLITGCGSYWMKMILSSLLCVSERQIKIIGVDASPNEEIRPFLDLYFKVPKSSDFTYIDKVFKICNENDVDVIIPTIDCELPLFAKNRKRFEEIGCTFNLSSYESIKRVQDKSNLLCELRNESFIPRFSIIRNVKDFSYFYEKDFVLKYPFGEGSRGLAIVSRNVDAYDEFIKTKRNNRRMTFDECLNIVRSMPSDEKLIAQELLTGTEYSMNFLCDKGSIVECSGKINKVVENSMPLSSVSWFCEEAYSIGKKVISKFGLHGNIGMDFMFKNAGSCELKLLEVNPRITATSGFDTVVGKNLIYGGIKQALGEELPTFGNGKKIRKTTKIEEVFKEEE